MVTVDTTNDTDTAPRSLPFPPLTTSHILACSYHSWHPNFRSHSPKARLVALSQPFLDYLHADGIVLPSDSDNDDDSSTFSDPNDNEDARSHSNSSSVNDDDDDDEEDPTVDPSEAWPDIHSAIRSTIASLGGAVLPKLNWSAPKDATWMSPTNDMTCNSANEVYLLLKSSDFITHDLEHAFDDCIDDTTTSTSSSTTTIPYHLVLRKKFEINPALEFRCFVRNRHLLAVSQRDMNHFDFLFDLAPRFKALIADFLHDVVLPKFHERSFVMDLYLSPQKTAAGRQQKDSYRVWLIDFNPWAQRTDPLLFSWLELLTMPGPDTELDAADDDEQHSDSQSETEEAAEQVIRIPLGPAPSSTQQLPGTDTPPPPRLIFDPEVRLVRRDDPEAYAFAATKYSAHKLPKDVVDASMTPSSMISMMEEWRLAMQQQESTGGQA